MERKQSSLYVCFVFYMNHQPIERERVSERETEVHCADFF
uniref:Uncharacterized protein n=1 Tax=Rhizophora mucronata TaxID=61149 RepID=A0A2P2L302_RHIMU